RIRCAAGLHAMGCVAVPDRSWPHPTCRWLAHLVDELESALAAACARLAARRPPNRRTWLQGMDRAAWIRDLCWHGAPDEIAGADSAAVRGPVAAVGIARAALAADRSGGAARMHLAGDSSAGGAGAVARDVGGTMAIHSECVQRADRQRRAPAPRW